MRRSPDSVEKITHRSVTSGLAMPSRANVEAFPRLDRALRRLILALVVTALPGCGLARWLGNGFEVGPDYAEPAAPTASRWIDYEDPRVRSEEQDLSRWWRVFNDATLDSLVERAYEQNLTLKIAVERIAGSRARRSIAFGFLFPQTQQAFGGYSLNHESEEVANPVADETFSNWALGGALAWELDLWGRFRRAVEAADAELEASIAEYDDVLVVLFAEVASSYVLYRTYGERLTHARENASAQAASYTLAQERLQAGATTERDVQQARQILAETRSRIPELEAGLRQASNALCLLLGIPAQDLSATLGTGGRIPTVEPLVAAGIPADLVRRRPDVRRAERQAAAQSAAIGIAEADFYPRISLTGTIGVEAESFSNLLYSTALAGSFGPSFRWDILNYGRIAGNVRAQESAFRELALGYQESVLRAGKEVEDALVGFLKAHERAAHLAESATAARRTLEITSAQYRQGMVDFTPVFIFEGVLTEQEDLLAVARGSIALELIRLYRSLGGGWERRLVEGAGGSGVEGGSPPGGEAPREPEGAK